MKKYYLLIFIGLITFVLISLFLVSNLELNLYNNEIAKIEDAHESIKEKVLFFEKDKDTFILMISEHEKVSHYIQSRDITSFEETKRFLKSLTLSDNNIFQLRIFDIKGYELIRAERSVENKVFFVEEERLQNKAKHYYFEKVLKLKKGVVDFSKFDLNLENDEIQLPWHPTLNISTPIFKDDKKVGLVIINYSMKEWINSLSSITRDNFYLVDENGYFIYHHNDNWKWSYNQTPRIKADEYFQHSFNKENNLYAKEMRLFNKEKIFAIYEPKIPIKHTLYNYSLNVILYILLIFIFIFIPIGLLFYSIINTLRTEKKMLKATKDQITLVFNSTSEAIFVINKKAIIQDLNNAAIELFGYKKNELLGKNIKIIVAEPHKSKHDDYVKDYKDNEKASFFNIERNLYAVCKNNKQIPITLTVTSIEDSNGTLFMGSIKDISQIKEAKKKQAEQEAILLQQSKLAAMGEMLTAIAHQWRQPLNSVGLIIQDLVSAQKHNELDTQYLLNSKNRVLKQLNLMSNTIDEFRNFFSKNSLPSKFNILDLLKEVENLYWAQFKANNIVLKLKFDENKLDSFYVYNLSSEIKQVFLNIFANAKDAIVNIEKSNPYQREIITSIHEEENEIVVSIFDHAGGIPTKTLKRIFDPYYTTKESGTGLGLFIIKTLVDKHIKGSIKGKTYTSKSENVSYKGAVFTLHIPKKI